MNVQNLNKLTAVLWLAVPFPTYAVLVFLAQPRIYALVYGVPFPSPVPSANLTLSTALITLSAVIAMAVTGLVVGVTSWEMAKYRWRAPTGGSGG